MVGADTPSVNRYHVILGRAWQATGTCVRIGKNALRAASWTRDHNFKSDPNHSFRHYVIFKVFLLLWMCKICLKSQEDYYYYFCVITMLLGNKSCTVGMPFYYSLNGMHVWVAPMKNYANVKQLSTLVLSFWYARYGQSDVWLAGHEPDQSTCLTDLDEIHVIGQLQVGVLQD